MRRGENASRPGARRKRAGRPKTSSWGPVAQWYDSHLESSPDTYQSAVIAPNLLRVLALKKGERIIDIACGQGYFSRRFALEGAVVIGADISPELIENARMRAPGLEFHVAPADSLFFAHDNSFDAAAIVLAIQNIENMNGIFAECRRVLKPRGRLALVMNHPAFRIPKRSSWGWDEEEKRRYRRIDGYLSSSSERIEMHPGADPRASTISYHRSLQEIFKALGKAGFSVTRLEEWISHKKSERGARQAAEDTARKEIPLFLLIEARP